MRLISAIRERLRALFLAERENDATAEEMEFHVEMEAQRRMREDGLGAREARRRASLAFGGVDKHREAVREARGLAWLSSLRLDVKLGFRMLIKYPGLTIAGILAIAVAVGVASAWFEFSGYISRPSLGFPDADQVVILDNFDDRSGDSDARALHDFELWRDGVRSLEQLTAVSQMDALVTAEDGRYVTARGARATPDMFALLGVQPIQGRTLLASDVAADAPDVVVIGYDLWQRLLDGGDVRGRILRVGRTPMTIVGVMPERFGFPSNQEFWVPLRDRAVQFARGEGPSVRIFGRIAPGRTLEEAQAELAAIGERTALESPATNEYLRPRVRYLESALGGSMRTVATLMNVPFLLFLVVVCGNVASLVIARTSTRMNEIALRSAIGASRGRIVAQLVAEALVLTTAGVALGLAMTWYGMEHGMPIFWEVQQSRPPYWFDGGLSWQTLAYGGLLAVVAALMIGGIPALKATGPRLRQHLTSAGGGAAGLRFGAISTGMIVLQVALCVAFLPIAFTMAQGAIASTGSAAVFPAEEYLTGRIASASNLEDSADPAPAADSAAAQGADAGRRDELRRRLLAEASIQAVAFASWLPGFNHPVDDLLFEADSSEVKVTRTLEIDPEYFRVMNMRVIAGRGFGTGDYTDEPRVAIVDEEWAGENLAGSPLGQRFRYPKLNGEAGLRWYEVVGVVRGAEEAIGPGSGVAIFVPLDSSRLAGLQLFARTSVPPATLTPRIHDIVGAIDPDLNVQNLMSLDAQWRPVERGNLLLGGLVTAIALVILLFALNGTYALLSFTVSRRTREIAVRAALGADPRRILRSIFSRALLQIGLGIVIGAVLVSFAVLEDPNGLPLVAGVAVLMLLAGIAACVLPARRALRIQPTEALKGE
ncbi:MAG TPA: ABC transporter permease [Longimicrobiales bacterium]|nr:ABC transporter permease [Longimicrobiales bacterium]